MKLICAMAVACAAIQLTAMPTEEETKLAEPVVKKLLASGDRDLPGRVLTACFRRRFACSVWMM